MTTRMLEVIDGEIAPDVSHHDGLSARARKREIEALLSVIRCNRAHAARRRALMIELGAIERRLAELKRDTMARLAQRDAKKGPPQHART